MVSKGCDSNTFHLPPSLSHTDGIYFPAHIVEVRRLSGHPCIYVQNVLSVNLLSFYPFQIIDTRGRKIGLEGKRNKAFVFVVAAPSENFSDTRCGIFILGKLSVLDIHSAHLLS